MTYNTIQVKYFECENIHGLMTEHFCIGDYKTTVENYQKFMII